MVADRLPRHEDRSRYVRLGLVLMLGVGVTILPATSAAEPPVPEPEPTTRVPVTEGMSGTEAHAAGLEAYDGGRFADAVAYFERAYAVDGEPGDLYGWAQAMRNTGDCRRAIALYEQFIDLGVGGPPQVAAVQNVERCQEQLARQPEPQPPPEPEPEPEPEPTALTEPNPFDTPPPPRRPSPLAVSLLAVGSAATVAGAVVLGVGEVQRATQADAAGYQRFDALDARVDRLHVAGGVTLGAGVVLVAVGATLMALQRRRGRPETAALVVGHGALAVRLRWWPTAATGRGWSRTGR
ncbi:MAG: hypothetical protein K0V04_24865 [Deltaproteobacteria bacterium]|nr:hypothetical protein [Deltaproteobacteria bacterium]